MASFQLASSYKPTGDQPEAINSLTRGVENNKHHQVLLGVTGSGKTFSIANVIQNVQKPTLVIAHNKTLAAQLYQEFRDFFPNNAVSYFVSYYDYYQPEAYIPTTDTYIEKDSSINDEIDKLRLAATTNLMTRRDVIVVASVSCIYNLGSPVEYGKNLLRLVPGEVLARETLLMRLASLQYERTETELMRGTYRLRGDMLQIWPAYEDRALRIDTLENTIEEITWIDPISGTPIQDAEEIQHEFYIYPAKHYVINPNSQEQGMADIKKDLELRLKQLQDSGKTIEAFRLGQKIRYDLDMMQNLGFVNGIENYSRYFDGRKPGEPPYTLLDYFAANAQEFNTGGFLTVIDESHMTLPQVRGMFNGDQARKNTLVEYGFRLPSALDNRPLRFEEFLLRNNQFIHVSATPADWEVSNAQGEVVEQIIRPTGLVDPEVELRPIQGQIEDLVIEILLRKQKGERTLVTTLTKKMAEALTDYLNDQEKITKLVESFFTKKQMKEDNPDADVVIRANEQLPIDDMEIGPLDTRFFTQAEPQKKLSPTAITFPKVAYLHSDVDTMERSDILSDLRAGVYDVVVGINLLREGLDLPEVTLVAILDADKEGFLRSATALIQTMGRAARHAEGHVLLYADRLTGSMKQAIGETQRRRAIQTTYNQEHGITPQTISKPIRERMVKKTEEKRDFAKAIPKTIIELSKKDAIDLESFDPQALTPSEKNKLIKQLRRRMHQAADEMDFELAALLRDTLAKVE